jgi:hypothetical protein
MPIEPSPITAMRGFPEAVFGMRRSPLKFLAAGIHRRLCLWVSRLGRAAKA